MTDISNLQASKDLPDTTPHESTAPIAQLPFSLSGHLAVHVGALFGLLPAYGKVSLLIVCQPGTNALLGKFLQQAACVFDRT